MIELMILKNSKFFIVIKYKSFIIRFQVIVDYPVPNDGVSDGASSISHRASCSLYEGLEKRVSHLSQGLYMKHLLKHLTTPKLTISEIFARLYSSFTQGELQKIDTIHYNTKQNIQSQRYR